MKPNRVRAVALKLTAGLGALGVLACLPACGLGHGKAEAAPTEEDSGAPPDDSGVHFVVPDSAPNELPDSGSFVSDAPATGACATGANLIYVASEERNLYSFDPTAATFSLLGNIDCAQGVYVNSMAVDRNATAWINFGDGSLWKADTQHPVCTATGFLPNQQGVGLFGMGFAAKTAGSSEDLLFIDDLSGGGLGYIDQSTMTLNRLGPFTGDLANEDCELTGTSNASLFGFFAGGPLSGDAGAASVVALDPTSQSALSQWPLTGVETGSDWAFAAWGGDFYLFTADKYDMTDPYTTVTRFRPSDGSLTVLAQNIGFRVVGAASSTCAPVTITQ
jgi:hypothetical protein